MALLLCNDDGVTARGLSQLHKVLSFLGEEVVETCRVVAPDGDCSGFGQSLTLDRPLRVKEHSNGFYSVDGTPADCVNLAVNGLLEEVPRRVISGINRGPNLGDDVLYSGTVGAAMEGRFLEKTAMAISSCGRQDWNLEVSAQVFLKLFPRLDELELPQGTILNVNVPDCPWESIRGMKVTRLGHRLGSKPPVQVTDPRGNKAYWIGGVGKARDAGEGTDFHAIANGFVSVTPLQYDKTDHNTLSQVDDWLGA